MTSFSFAPASQPPIGTAVQPAAAVAVAATAPAEAIYAAALRCNVFGDDRDALVARWNLLQSSWGCGKLYHSKTAPPISVDQSNPICRFKAMGYSALPRADDGSGDDADDELSLIVRMKLGQLEPLKDQFAGTLHQVMGGRPNVKVNVSTIRDHGQDSSEVVVTVTEEAIPGSQRRVPAHELESFLSQPSNAASLQQKLNVGRVFGRKASLSSKQIREYCDRPPAGVDPRLWAQAQMDNPDPERFLPVPLLGFRGVHGRVKSQELQAKRQQERARALAAELLDLKKRHEQAAAKSLDVKRKHFELAHRVLSVIVRQESTRKLGFAVTYDEEKTAAKLDALQSQLSAPTQFKGRISELLSQVRFMNHSAAGGGSSAGAGEKYSVEAFVQCDIHNLLKRQQDGIAALVDMTKNDLTDLQKILD